MIKKSIAGIAFFMYVAVAVAIAQHTVTVTVVEAESRRPLPGASIHLHGTIYQGKSDAGGMVIIRNIKEGNYTITVSYLGYQTQQKHFTLTGNQQVDILLH